MSTEFDLHWDDGEQAWTGDIVTPNIRAMLHIRTGSCEHRPSAQFCEAALSQVAKLDRTDQRARAYLADKSQAYVLDKYRLIARPDLFTLVSVEMHAQAPANEYALCYAVDRDPSRLWRVAVREVTPQNWICIPRYRTMHSLRNSGE